MNALKLQDGDPITKDDGLKVGARVAKNRCVYDNPYKKCEYYVIYGEGVDKMFEVMEAAPEAGILRKSGSWYYYEKEDGELIISPEATVDGKVEKDFPMKFQGKTKLRQFLSENEWFLNQLKDEIRGKVKRGELMPKFQDENELKEIEKLNEMERQIAQEIEDGEKEAIKKTTAKKRPVARKKAEETTPEATE